MRILARFPLHAPASAREGFWRERSGQSMLFTALTIMILIVMVGLVVGVGEVSSDQMRVQNAADASAYAAAAVQADCMSQIAWLNEAAAAIYYKALADSVSNITTGTKMSLNYVWYDPSANGTGLPGLPAQASITPGDPDGVLSWGKGGKEWYLRLIKIERLIAVLAPFLVRNQVYQTAHANFYLDSSGSDAEKPLRLAIYPNPGNARNPAWSFFPEGGSYHNVIMEHNPTDLGDNAVGWRMTSESDPAYKMDVIHVVIDENKNDAVYNQWHVLFDQPDTSSKTKSSNASDVITHLELLIDEYRYSDKQATEKAFTVTELNEKKEKTNKRVAPEHYTGQMYLVSEVLIDYNQETKYEIRSYAEKPGGEIVMVYSGTEELNEDGTTNKFLCEYFKNSDGDPVSIVNGVEYKQNDDGSASIGGKTIAKTVKINGRTVPVSAPTGLTTALGAITIWPSFAVNIQNKLRAWQNKNELVLEYRFNDSIGWIAANDKRARVRDLTTLSPSERWRSPGGEEGRMFHRLTEYPFEEKNFGDPWDRYKYELTNVGSYLQEMSLRKLGLRGLMVNSSDAPLPSALQASGYVPQATIPTQYNGKNNKFKTDDGLWTGFDASNVWNLLAKNKLLWACPPRTPTTAAQAAEPGAFGGYLDLSTGQMYSRDDKNQSVRPYVYSLTGGTSPYAAKIRSRFYSGQWQLMRYTYTLYENSLLGTQNPLWTYYASFANEVPDEDADESVTRIPISDSIKDSCGFFVIGEYDPGSEASMDSFYTLLKKLDRMQITSPRPESGIVYNKTYFVYIYKNYWYLAIWDPYASLAMFNHQPKYPFLTSANASVETDLYAMDAAGTKPSWSQMKSLVAHTPTVVRRYAYHAFGLTMIPEKVNFSYNGFGCDIGEVKVNSMRLRPLEASSQIFRTPVVVCAWMPQKIGWLAPLLGRTSYDSATEKQRRIGIGNPLYITSETDTKKWSSGHFALAAARVFFRPSQSGSSGEFITNFAYCGDDYENQTATAGKQAGAALEYPNYVNAITMQHMSGYCERWLGSLFNLFEPEWGAALVPLNAALKLEDVIPDSEIIDASDTPGAFIMRQFNTAGDNYRNAHHSTNDGWIKNAYEFYSGWSQEDQKANRAWFNVTAPPLQGDNDGKAVDWDNENMQNLIAH